MQALQFGKFRKVSDRIFDHELDRAVLKVFTRKQTGQDYLRTSTQAKRVGSFGFFGGKRQAKNAQAKSTARGWQNRSSLGGYFAVKRLKQHLRVILNR